MMSDKAHVVLGELFGRLTTYPYSTQSPIRFTLDSLRLPPSCYLAAISHLVGAVALEANTYQQDVLVSADLARKRTTLPFAVQELALGCCAWLRTDLEMSSGDLAGAILDEREYQTEKFGRNENCTPTDWVAVLMEEVGEVAVEVLALRFARGDQDRLRRELVQVAAVCVFWLEVLDGAQ